MNIFAIGDIHGCLEQLVGLHKKIFNHQDFNKDKDLLIYFCEVMLVVINTREYLQ